MWYTDRVLNLGFVLLHISHCQFSKTFLLFQNGVRNALFKNYRGLKYVSKKYARWNLFLCKSYLSKELLSRTWPIRYIYRRKTRFRKKTKVRLRNSFQTPRNMMLDFTKSKCSLDEKVTNWSFNPSNGINSTLPLAIYFVLDL